MISNTGENLSVLIITETGKDWQAFGTWYSIYKNLPNAKVAIACARNSETPFQYFQWTKRLNVPTLRYNRFDLKDEKASWLDVIGKMQGLGMIGNKVLAIEPLVMLVDVLDQKLLSILNSGSHVFDNNVWFLNEPNVADMMNGFLLGESTLEITENSLCIEAKDNEDVRPIVSYRKGCGKWIDTLKGCPFSNANGLMTASMTPNENRIVELWKRMCSLYSVVV